MSCGKKTSVIPRSKMTLIYADIAMVDEQIMAMPWNDRKAADTCLVYAPILEKYGYTVEDFLESEKKYIKDPTRYIRMIKNAVLMLEEESRELKKEKEKLDMLHNRDLYMQRFHPNVIYMMDSLDLGDTVLFDFDFQQGMDTIFAGPALIIPADTLLVPADTLATPADTLVANIANVAL